MDLLTIHDIPTPGNVPLHDIRVGDLICERMCIFRVTEVHEGMNGQYIRCKTYPVNWYSDNVNSPTIQWIGPYAVGTGRMNSRAAVIRSFRTTETEATERLYHISEKA